jgi:hypothetical protein
MIVAGALALVGGGYAHKVVRDQLVPQKIFFTDNAKELPGNLKQYAGEQVDTAKEAKVFANDYIGLHLEGVAKGQTYSEVSGQFITMKPTDPNYQKVAQTRQTLFMGETLRGLLLNAYAFWKMGQIAIIAAIVSFITGGVMLLLSALGFWHLRRVSPEAEVLPNLGTRTKVAATV